MTTEVQEEAKEKIEGRISTSTEDLSKLIDEAAMRKRKSLEKVMKRTNHTTKKVEFIWKNPATGEETVVESRDMLPAEYQLKLAIDNSIQNDNVVSITDGEDAGADPASFEESTTLESETVQEAQELLDSNEALEDEDHELGDNVVDDEGFVAPSEAEES